jgi:MinD-like ATPase involved in chromosome partitioning or flagellar assembly
MIIEWDISSVMVVTDRDEASDAKIKRKINDSFDNISFNVAEWTHNMIMDSFKQSRNVNTYLLIIPENENGALERVIINALNDIPEEKNLIQEVTDFIDSLKLELVPDLNQVNKSNKATVGTFFSVRNPQNAMRAFSIIISKIDWSKSESIRKLFMPFTFLGQEKPIS